MILHRKSEHSLTGAHFRKANKQQASRQERKQSSAGKHMSKASNQPNKKHTVKEKMGTMIFQVGHELEIQGTHYAIIGSIDYEDKKQKDRWVEYRLRCIQDDKEHWLSIDHKNDLYELSRMVPKTTVPDGFKLVDKGTEVVRGRSGSVDVDMYESALFETYEDESKEHTFSIEIWSDEAEYSRGTYVKLSDIHNLGKTEAANKEVLRARSRSCAKVFVYIAAIIVSMTMCMLDTCDLELAGDRSTGVSVNLASNTSYTLEATVTDDGAKANVYSTSQDVATTAKDIIRITEGSVKAVQEDEDARTVAILTPNEYILVYEDAGVDGMGLGDKESATSTGADLGSSGDDASDWNAVHENVTQSGAAPKTLVQVSMRKYAYTTDRRPYHARYRTYRWYRRFYRSQGYSTDSRSYGESTSSYGSYTGETVITSSSTNTYESYAESIRQQSVGTSSSSGGGTSFGK